MVSGSLLAQDQRGELVLGVYHVVGAGGLQLCSAAEAPGDAGALKAGIVAGQVMVDVTKATEPRKTTVIFKYTCNDDGEWSADDSVNSEMMDAMLS